VLAACGCQRSDGGSGATESPSPECSTAVRGSEARCRNTVPDIASQLTSPVAILPATSRGIEKCAAIGDLHLVTGQTCPLSPLDTAGKPVSRLHLLFNLFQVSIAVENIGLHWSTNGTQSHQLDSPTCHKIRLPVVI
jgi:hypothetical protein